MKYLELSINVHGLCLFYVQVLSIVIRGDGDDDDDAYLPKAQ